MKPAHKEANMHIRKYLAALELVNEERRRMGLPVIDHLPKGIPGNGRRCVIANAIPGTVVGHHSIGGMVRRSLPRDVRSFIAAFDQSASRKAVDPGSLVDGGIEDDKGCLVPA